MQNNSSFVIEKGVLKRCETTEKSVVIPAGVKLIASYAFYGCNKLENIEISDGVKKIEQFAFDDCTSLKSVTIPASVKEIGYFAFVTSSSLAQIRFGGTKEQWAAVKKSEHWRRSVSAKTVECTDGNVELPVFDIKDGILLSYNEPASNVITYLGAGMYSTEPCEDENDAPVVVPDGVIEIGNGAFYRCGIKSVILPDSVTKIGDQVFDECCSLESVVLPPNLKEIGAYAFHDTEISSITIPDSVTKLGDGAFCNAYMLESVTIPAGLTKISDSAFSLCQSLKSVKMPQGKLKKIGKDAFAMTDLRSVLIPEGVTTIGDEAFDYCPLKSVTLPESLRTIGSGVFKQCNNLISVTIPKGIKEIGNAVFAECKSLKEIRYNGTKAQWKSVKKGWAWHHAAPASTVECADGTVELPLYEIEDGILFSFNSVDRPAVIPAGVTTIAGAAFYLCQNIPSVTIPDGVIEIGDEAFCYCCSLENIKLPSSLKKIGEEAFSGCAFTSIEIPDGVEEIGDQAFEFGKLNSISISASVKKIGARLFYDSAHTLSEIRFGGTTAQWEAIEKGADWNECVPATHVLCSDGTVELQQFKIKDGVLIKYTGKDSSFAIPDGVTEIGEEAFYDNHYSFAESMNGVTLESTITSLSIPDTVTKIGENAFENCSSLASLALPGSVTKIGSDVFKNCSSLAELSFGGTKEQWAAVTKENRWNKGILAKTIQCTDGSVELAEFDIKDGCLISYNGTDSSVVIPDGVTKISGDDDLCSFEDGAFRDCMTLKSVVIPGTVTEIGRGTFSHCKQLESVTFPGSVRTIGQDAFAYCESLVSLDIPDGVTTICYYAFSGCKSLTAVTIPASVKKIEHCVFCNCWSLLQIRYAGTKDQWAAIEKSDSWNSRLPAEEVLCTDGNAAIPQYVIKDGVLSDWLGRYPSDIVIPDGVTELGYRLFDNSLLGENLAGTIKSVSIPASVIKIGGGVFDCCNLITSITLPAGVTEIGDYAFRGCESLADFRFGGTKAQWAAVVKGIEWHEDVPAKCVVCADGTVEL